ncbi:MAG: GNAT family N-acetyltransferase [Flavobacteriaceae bacterium]|jgi:GNAT superfamily N-acetyltransferase|nr:GNAT family N-acetyltransferase [Flavobacteriaceae bacterium]NVJ72959.1 GNAT family N-acetyltransferase [Flavobacteriaceae bacterium]
MSYLIRTAKPTDMKEVLGLIQELAVFENEPYAVEITEEDLIRDGFEGDAFKCFVAEKEARIVGIALVYPRYSTWKGVALHLEDLIVTQSLRGSGIGSALLKQVVDYAKELGVKRVSWDVLDWNEPAISFYEAKGAKVLRDWDVVQLDEQGIKNFK